MARTWLLAAFLAVFGAAAIPAAASAADGLAESARTLYWGYLTGKYNETLQYFERKNLKAGMASIEELKQLEDNLLGLVYSTQEKAEKLSDDLGDTWGDTLESVEDLIRITGVVKNQIGHGALPIAEMRAAYDALGIDLEKSYAAMTKFGAGYTELLGWAKQSVDTWDSGVEDTYEDTMDLLKAENFAEGEDYLQELKKASSDVYDYSRKSSELAKTLTPRLASQWSDALVSSAQAFTNEVGAFQLKLWEQQLFFDDIDRYYNATFAYLEDAYAETRVVGDEYFVMCRDGCK